MNETTTDDSRSRSRVPRSWRSILAAIGAALLGFAILVVGGSVSGAIVPGIILHAVSDFIVLPMQYGVIPSAGQCALVWQGWLSLLAGAAAIPAFRQLARATALARAGTARAKTA